MGGGGGGGGGGNNLLPNSYEHRRNKFVLKVSNYVCNESKCKCITNISNLSFALLSSAKEELKSETFNIFASCTTLKMKLVHLLVLSLLLLTHAQGMTRKEIRFNVVY